MSGEATEKTVEERMREINSGSWHKDPGHVPELLRKASPRRLHDWGHTCRYHEYVVPGGTDPLALLQPDYWTPIHAMLGPHDWIRVFEEAGAFLGLLEVIRSDVTAVHVERIILAPTTIAPGVRGAGLKNTLGIVVVYRGAQRKWSAELGDKVLKDEFATEGEAGRWAAGYIATRSQG
jgi:hypothetical protein